LLQALIRERPEDRDDVAVWFGSEELADRDAVRSFQFGNKDNDPPSKTG